MARKKPVEPVTVEPVTVEPVTVEPVTVEPVTVELTAVNDTEQIANLQYDAAVDAVETSIAHIDAVATVNHEMQDIATVRGDIKTRTDEVKAICVKLMLWYVANMPLHLELSAAINKGRILAYAKTDIKHNGEKDSFGPVRGEFDGLRTRLLHTATDPRGFILPETTYETFNVSVILENVPTVAKIRKDKTAADKTAAVNAAVEKQALEHGPVDVSAQFAALTAENIELRETIATHERTISELNDTILKLKAVNAEQSAALTVRHDELKHVESKYMEVVSENTKLRKRGDIADSTLKLS